MWQRKLKQGLQSKKSLRTDNILKKIFETTAISTEHQSKQVCFFGMQLTNELAGLFSTLSL